MPQPLIYHLIDEFRVGGAQTHLVTILADAQRRFPYRHRVGGLFEEGPIADDLRALGISPGAASSAFRRQRSPACLVASALSRATST
jgi:hypothetical protein